MASNNVTITGKVGPGITITAQLFNNVTNLEFDYVAGTIWISYNDNETIKRVSVQLTGTTTVTYTISSGIATVTIS